MYMWFSVSITYINRYIYIIYIHHIIYTTCKYFETKPKNPQKPNKIIINVVHLTNKWKQLNQMKMIY